MKKRTFEKAKELLQSFDIEMVRLGARLLQQCTPEKKWAEVINGVATLVSDNVEYSTKLWASRNWTWKIEKGEIIIEEIEYTSPFLASVWSKNPTRTLKLVTGGMNMINNSIKKHYNTLKTKNKNNEQTKKHWRKQAK